MQLLKLGGIERIGCMRLDVLVDLLAQPLDTARGLGGTLAVDAARNLADQARAPLGLGRTERARLTGGLASRANDAQRVAQ